MDRYVSMSSLYSIVIQIPISMDEHAYLSNIFSSKSVACHTYQDQNPKPKKMNPKYTVSHPRIIHLKLSRAQ